MDLINEISKNYNINPIRIETLSGGWLNEKYLITTDNGNQYVLKELSLKKFSKEHINYLINTVKLQNYLFNKNVMVPKIIMDKYNNCVSTFSDNRLFFIQEFIKGYSKKFNDLNCDEIYSIGRNLAILHNKLKNVDIYNFESEFLKYKNINDLKSELSIKKKQISYLSSEKFNRQIILCEKILKDIQENKILEKQDIQIIHGDFTPDNIIFINNEVKSIIDFELVRVNSKLQDIGRIILSTTFYKNKFELEKLKSFINGYSSINKIENYQIIDALKIVWINEFDIWIQDRYFKNYNPPKVERFISEIIWISENWFDLENKIGDVKIYGLKKN